MLRRKVKISCETDEIFFASTVTRSEKKKWITFATWKKFLNATLHLRLGRSSTLANLSQNRNCLKTRGILNFRLFVFMWTENVLKTDLFDNGGVWIIIWSLWRSFPQTQINKKKRIQWPVMVFKFLRRNVSAKHLMHFRSETSLFIFLFGAVWKGP